MIRPFEQQAKRNHDQDLATLARRGGLDMTEALAILHAEDYVPYWQKRLGNRMPDRDNPPKADLILELLELVKTRQSAQTEAADVLRLRAEIHELEKENEELHARGRTLT